MSAISEEDDDMATLAVESPSTSPPFNQRRKSWARRLERICYKTLSYFPLTFVYGLTTWAVWVETRVSLVDITSWLSWPMAALGVVLYCLANASYTIAVFTPPGSPMDPRGSSTRRNKGRDYEGLPTYEHEEEMQVTEGMSTVTAKSTGKQRYCKKCKTIKPDRTHHCSTCKQCVLKMDHHCPWLATCVGLHNYKAFLLFLVYTSLFCWTCFGVSVSWVWYHLMENIVVDDGWKLVNTIMLSVLGGIIGLVLSGFTSWHIWLALSGTTTIESLEKTRYLSPLRKSMERRFEPGRNYLGQDRPEEQQTMTEHLREMHVNALPGVLRPEEGEVQTSVSPQPSARESLQRSYASLEADRERNRYEAYLDERDSEKMPNAFDLGWKRNILHLLGEKPLLWALPVCNTTGDGWQWEVSQKWVTAREELGRERAQRQREDAQWDQHHSAAPYDETSSRNDLRWVPGQGFVAPRRAHHEHTAVHMQPLDRRKQTDQDDVDSYATSSDEEHRRAAAASTNITENWNDLPDDLLNTSDNHAVRRSRSRARNKHD